jgi:tight adherence protein C
VIALLVIAVAMFAVAVFLITRALLASPRAATGTLEQIDAYGFSGALSGSEGDDHSSLRERFDDLANKLGAWLGSRFERLRTKDMRSRLISAGMYTTTPERILGLQLLFGIGFPLVYIVLAWLAGVELWLIVVGAAVLAAAGWILPSAQVDYRARKRREQIEKDLPDLIDLIVVCLEAGLSFPQSLRLASTKIKDPLASEVRLTLQEQNMGLTLVEALENFLVRIDTPGVRMFARSISQGETLGVSTGQIMRNLAIELRKRRRAYAEERAQKAPVKVLFPILFLIMPAIFIVLLMPLMIRITDTL